MERYKGLDLDIDLMMQKRLIFSNFFVLQNKMQTLFDNHWKELTSKQWLILIIASVFPEPPSLTEVAAHAGCSRQNIKKIAVILEKKGFINLMTEKETRAVRLVLTQKFYDFYHPFLEETNISINYLFEGMTDDEIVTFFNLLHRFGNNIDQCSNLLSHTTKKTK